MTFFKTTAAVALLSVCAAGASASTMPIDTSAYDSSVVELDEFGILEFEGTSELDAFFALDLAGFIVVGGAPSTDADAFLALDFDLDLTFDVEIFGASGSEYLDGSFSLFFEDATNGYLFTFVSDSAGVEFGDPNAVLDVDGTLTIEKFSVSTVAPVPLPAGLPLILAGLGSFYMVGRRRKSA